MMNNDGWMDRIWAWADERKISESTLPRTEEALSALTELDLRFNQLTSLPPEIGNLTNLTKLNLEGNELMSLPESIGNLTNLTDLDLDRNLAKKVGMGWLRANFPIVHIH